MLCVVRLVARDSTVACQILDTSFELAKSIQYHNFYIRLIRFFLKVQLIILKYSATVHIQGNLCMFSNEISNLFVGGGPSGIIS